MSHVKRQKLSEDFIEDGSGDENNTSQESTQKVSVDENADSDVKVNEEGESFLEISSKRRVTIRNWKGNTLIDIREYWGDDGSLKPGKKGISLSADQWSKL